MSRHIVVNYFFSSKYDSLNVSAPQHQGKLAAAQSTVKQYIPGSGGAGADGGGGAEGAGGGGA